MIRHCVFLRFRAEVPQAERDGIESDLRALQPLIDGFLAMSYGKNVSPEGLGQGFDHGFTMDFRDAAARDAYLVHPAHQAVGRRVVAAMQGGTDGLVVFDLEM